MSALERAAPTAAVAERTLRLPAEVTPTPRREVAEEEAAEEAAAEVTPIPLREAVEAVAEATARVRTENTRALLKETGAVGRHLSSTCHCPCPPYWHSFRVGVKAPYYARA